MSAKQRQSLDARQRGAGQHLPRMRVKEGIEPFMCMCRNVGNNLYSMKRVEIGHGLWDREIRDSSPQDPEIARFVS